MPFHWAGHWFQRLAIGSVVKIGLWNLNSKLPYRWKLKVTGSNFNTYYLGSSTSQPSWKAFPSSTYQCFGQLCRFMNEKFLQGESKSRLIPLDQILGSSLLCWRFSFELKEKQNKNYWCYFSIFNQWPVL